MNTSTIKPSSLFALALFPEDFRKPDGYKNTHTSEFRHIYEDVTSLIETTKKLEEMKLEGNPNMFEEINPGFILRQEHDGTVVAIAVEENGVQRNPTDDEKKTAQVLGLRFVPNFI
jgi:hypothetical protein